MSPALYALYESVGVALGPTGVAADADAAAEAAADLTQDADHASEDDARKDAASYAQ